ncbi:MAG: UbiD family decarboxylase [Alphaproteobacteria bacterium]|nr:UbiD family decarboxylase [Alphaproteobacteria bacterium]
MTANVLHDLGLILAALEARGRLIRVASEVDPVHELAGIAARFEGGPRAILFERVRGHAFPVCTGLYWSRELLADLLGKEERALPQYVSGCIRAWQQRPVDPVVVATGPVLEVTEPTVDLGRLPAPTHAAADGGAYFDASVVIARDPETGVRNASIQRFMVTGRDTMTVNIDAGRHLELYLEKARARGESLFFTLNCGVGPGLHFAAATPAEAAPADTDELGIASEFHGAPLELVPGTVSAVEMVAHAMIALECEMVPGEVADEGPFAEVTGYYARREPRPVVHVRRIHRRRAPVFQTIISGKEVWNSVGLLGEANVLALLQRQVPGVADVYFTHGGCGFYHAVVALRQKRAGWGKQAIMATFAAFPPLKMVTVVDDDVDIRSASDVEWAMATRLDPAAGILVVDKVFGHGLNPGFPGYLGAKVGFDACRPFPFRSEHERAFFKPVDLARHDLRMGEPRAAPGTGAAAAIAPPPAGGGAAM